MSSRALVMVLAAAAALAAARASAAGNGINWADFTARSSSSDDPLLISALDAGDYETRAAICSAVGRRPDPSAHGILSWLLDGYASGRVYQAELLLRFTLVSLFGQGPGVSRYAARISANAADLTRMVDSIDSFHDPQLRGVIIRLLPSLNAEGGRRALMSTGIDIIASLRSGNGTLTLQETSLAFDYLDVVTRLGDMDFFEQCLEISRLSRDKGLVTASRAAARVLSGTD